MNLLKNKRWILLFSVVLFIFISGCGNIENLDIEEVLNCERYNEYGENAQYICDRDKYCEWVDGTCVEIKVEDVEKPEPNAAQKARDKVNENLPNINNKLGLGSNPLIEFNETNDTQEVPITGTCVDSDNGKDYFVKGTADNNERNQHGTDYCMSDNPSKLLEFYCATDEIVANAGYICPNGCSNGACISNTTAGDTTTGFCFDSDGGKILGTKGIITFEAAGINWTKTDNCITLTSANGSIWNLEEWSCDGTDAGAEAVYCANGCSNGACIAGGSTDDSGPPNNETQEEEPSAGTVYCLDTDGGQDYYVKGYTEASGNFASQTDYCTDSMVHEHYCYLGDILASGGFICPNGCYNGACVNTTVVSECSDSDGGKNFGTKGTVTETAGLLPQTDHCVDWGGGRLIEWYCFQSRAVTTVSSCSCSNGACI